ncbi:DMT family transporter [Antrihabitans sp. YC2-6]|uniref:DMT family transporter n=1 Tax=Antrihabitans sp. YC2-6 TaxID=2799498 RepID=UPI0018F3A75A|nr:DMT family transporter [Antrihabitans sp. YC2-6]MBJ8346128.1 DMT family transporter [Antrihabitans sp. YC2-6]
MTAVVSPAVRQDWRALAAISTTVVAWASAFVAIRWLAGAFDAVALSLGRLLVGSALLGAALLWRGRWVAPTAREWRLLVLCGLAWFGVYNIALNAGEQRIDAGTAAMLVNIGPILIAVFAGLFLGEGFPKWLVIGVGVAFAGAATIGLSTSQSPQADVWGVLLCLVAALTYAIGVLAQKPVLGRLPALQVTWIACTIGAVACLPATPDLVDQLGNATGGEVGALVYLGAVPTALAFGTWAYALARTNAGRLGVTTYLSPPIVGLLAWVLLGDVPPLLAIVGGVICLCGVALSRRR